MHRTGLALTLFCLAMIAAPANAADDVRTFDISSQLAGPALIEFARQADITVVFSHELVANEKTNAVHGTMSISDAMEALLSGTRVRYERTSEKSIAIDLAPGATSDSGSSATGRELPAAPPNAAPSAPPGNSPTSTDRPPSTANRTSGTTSSEGLSQLEPIIVTSRKNAERLQDVPMSIAVTSGETITKIGAVILQDLGRVVPGLSINSAGPGQNSVFIRGLSGGNTVGFYVDDTPLAILGNPINVDAFHMDPALYDLARVEVLRGPQGTLYGASSMGGTVRYITNRPDLTDSYVTLGTVLSYTEGGGPNEEVSALVNTPLASGRVGLRAMAFARNNEGYIDRYPTDPQDYLGVLPGPVEKNANSEFTYGGRVVLEAQPNDALSVTLSATYQDMDLDAPFTFDKPPGSFSNRIQSRIVDEPTNDKSGLYALTIEGEIGEVQITSSTSYFDRDVSSIEDESKQFAFFFEMPEVFPSPLPSEAKSRYFIQELRTSWSVGRMHATVGAFYADSNATGILDWPMPVAVVPDFGADPLFFGIWDYDETQTALFGEVNIDLASNLVATIGARAFNQEQTLFNHIEGLFNGGVVSEFNGTIEEDGITPKFALSSQVTPDTLVYVSATEGFRGGGNVISIAADECSDDLAALGLDSFPTSFDPDSIWSYELGVKSAWLERGLALNAAIYHIDWNDIQQSVLLPCGITFTGNFGSAVSEGVELEMQYQSPTGLLLALGMAYNDAHLTSTVPGTQGQAGQTLQYAPQWMGSLSAEYNRDLSATTSVYARVDVSAVSEQFANFNTESQFRDIAGNGLTNLRFGMNHNSWRWSLFISNLFDKHVQTGLPIANGVDLPTTRRLALNKPRTIGVDLRFDF